MLCNFTEKYNNSDKIFSDFLSCVGLFCLSVIVTAFFSAIFSFDTVSFLVVDSIIFLILFLAGNYFLYVEENRYRALEYSKTYKYKSITECSFDDFMDWYSVNPKRFVFSYKNDGFYYDVDGKYINRPDNEMIKSVFEETALKGCTFVSIKGYIDRYKYGKFVNKLYIKMKKAKDTELDIQAKKKSEEELLRVLTSVEWDINNILKDSQEKIERETDRLNQIKQYLDKNS